MDWLRIGGATLLSGLLLGAILLGGPLSNFFAPGTIALLTLGTLSAWAVMAGPDLSALRAALGSGSAPPETLARALRTARTGRRALWSVVAVLVALSTVQVFQRLGDLDAMTPILATIFYLPLVAICMDIVVLTPLVQRVVGRAAELGVADQVTGTPTPLRQHPAAARRARRQTDHQAP